MNMRKTCVCVCVFDTDDIYQSHSTPQKPFKSLPLSLSTVYSSSFNFIIALMHSSARHIAKQIATHPETKSIAKQFQRNMASGTPSDTAKVQASADSNAPSFESVGIKNNSINQKSGVSLSQQQKVLVGSVLDVSMIG